MTLRSCLLAISLAVVPAVAVLATSDAAADTTRPEFFVGTALTAKADHALPTGATATATAQVKKGATGKVTKVVNSNGKPVKLDVKIGEQVFKGVPVAKIRTNFSYIKL